MAVVFGVEVDRWHFRDGSASPFAWGEAGEKQGQQKGGWETVFVVWFGGG